MKKHMMKKALSALLTAGIALTSISTAASPVLAAADESLPTLTVDMAPEEERGLKHGASGWLYGLGDEGVPSANTMTPLKPHTAVQKAPNGMQHPNGDVLSVADTFLNAGGQDLQIYVPDYYALWFYEFSSTEEYMDILRMQAEECIAQGIAENVVYVLYNEPNENWIGGSYTDPETGIVSYGWDSLFWFWEDMYNMVCEVYEENNVGSKPRFAGLNLAGYNNDIMERYIKFCVEHSCMPDVVTWHDLSTGQFNNFDNEYTHYRGLEEKYLTPENAEQYGIDITPREIVINEYAATDECASPGNLVRWIGLFEEYNVAGCLPFWHLSNNLNGLAADNNEGNGAWWLYKWYGDMSGQYLPVTPTNAAKDTYFGVASLDENKKSANIVFGGVDGSSNIVLENINETDTFQDAEMVHVKLEATDYTGFHGAAEEPRIVKEGAVKVVDGKVTIPVSEMLKMSAYRLTISQATEDEAEGFLSTTWKKMYEAENGSLLGSAGITAITNNACSGDSAVNSLNGPSSAVEIQVTVPADGYYKYDMVYMAANGCDTYNTDNNRPYTAVQNLLIDGVQAEQMFLPTTLNWTMGGMYSTYIKLSAGTHTLRIQGADSIRYADVDCIYLTYKGPSEADIAFNKTYEAEQCEFNELLGNTTSLTTGREGNVDFVAGLEKASVVDGGGLRFNTIVPEDGMYIIQLRYSSQADANARIYHDNDTVNLDRLAATLPLENTQGEWKNAYQTLFLQKGINIIDIDTDAAIQLDYINVRETDAEPTAVVEAESGVLTGEAAIGTDYNVNQFASGNSYVQGIKAANGVDVLAYGEDKSQAEYPIYGWGTAVDLGEPVDKNSLTITVTVPEAGEYQMAVYQSNGELFGRHSYNAQMVERYASFSVNGGEAQKVVFRNTYSDEVFRSQVVPVTLQAGENTIKIYNDNSKVITNGLHNGGAWAPSGIDYNALTNYTPNFDKFVFYPVAAETGEIIETQTFAISTAYSEGGMVSADHSSVEAGETVRLTFTPDSDAVLVEAKVNGQSITEQLSKFGGVYILENVQQDVEAQAVFQIEEKETPQAEETYYYSVNCGDIDPTTLSPGDVFGSNQSVTEQFYGEDPVTGKMWGIVDTYEYTPAYPDWLTGEKTWPCENDGATDDSPRTKSFRYAKNQATSDVGIVYMFELEPNKTYNLELGFYVPSGWTSSTVPRTMKLVLNDTTVVNDNFIASNNSNDPFVIKTTGTADENGNLKIQIGHASNAVWGPVVSYIDIMEPGDKSALAEAIERAEGYEEGDYSQISWERLEAALAEAQAVNSQEAATNMEIAGALAGLLDAEQGLVEVEAYNSLAQLVESYQGQQQGLTSGEDWSSFQNAWENAKFALESGRFGTQEINDAASKLAAAAEKLLVLDSIIVAQEPAITEYYVGDAFDPSGLVVEAIDQMGGHHLLTDEQYTLSGYSLDQAGTVTVTVSYEGKEASFEVTVSERPVTPVTLKAIEVTKAGKTEYKVGDSFSTEGLEVTAYYTDGSSRVIHDYQISGFSSDTEGQKVVIVSYAEDGVTATTSFTVAVTADPGNPENPDDSKDPQDPDTPEVPGDSQDENTGDTSSEDGREETPATGDTIGVSMVILAGLCSLAGIGILLVVKRKSA